MDFVTQIQIYIEGQSGLTGTFSGSGKAIHVIQTDISPKEDFVE